jgi:hypothetical protein
VHFLRRGGDPAATDFYRRLWQALSGRTDVVEALESAMEGLDLARLEAQFLAYLPELVREPETRRKQR